MHCETRFHPCLCENPFSFCNAPPPPASLPTLLLTFSCSLRYCQKTQWAYNFSGIVKALEVSADAPEPASAMLSRSCWREVRHKFLRMLKQTGPRLLRPFVPGHFRTPTFGCEGMTAALHSSTQALPCYLQFVRGQDSLSSFSSVVPR